MIEKTNKIPLAKAKKKHFSAIWLAPILAFIISGWLLYNDYVNSGVEIRIVFDSGSRLIAGKTPVKYRGIEVGKVKEIVLSNSLDKIEAVVNLHRNAGILASEGMIYWIVRPELGLRKISGVETIFSGSYIEVRPPSLDEKILENLPVKRHFIGANRAPKAELKMPGTFITFEAENRGTLESESGVYFKDIKVGHIIEHKLNKSNNKITFRALIYEQYNYLTVNNIFLWRSNSIDLNLTSKGISLNTKFFRSMIEGGIEVGYFNNLSSKKLASSKVLNLHESRSLAKNSFYKYSKVKKFKLIAENLGNLSPGGPIYYKRVKVGEIDNYYLDTAMNKVIIKSVIYSKFKHLINSNSLFFTMGGPEIKAESSEIKINTPPLLSLMMGGIEFFNSSTIKKDKKKAKEFSLFESKSKAVKFANSKKQGLRIKLLGQSRSSLEYNSPIHYRQVHIGHVESTKLSGDGKNVEINLFIESKYSHLIKRRTKFWSASGIGTEVNLLGVKIKTESLKTILMGGVSLATPEEKRGRDAKNGDVFKLHDKPDKDWLEWSPKLSRR